MPIFKVNQSKASQVPIKAKGFANEAALHDFFADNLEEILSVKFLRKEHPITRGYIDTLGIDENNSPVIIKYKLKSDKNILTQGISYLAWLKKNKQAFEEVVQTELGKKIAVTWDQPRIILLAQRFNYHTIIAAGEWSKEIELITYSYYEPDILYLEKVYSPDNLICSRPTKKKPNSNKKESKYDINYHFSKTANELQPLAKALPEKILTLPGITEYSNLKSRISYTTTKNFACLEFKPTYIHVLVKQPHYRNDPKALVRDITTHAWGYKGQIKLTRQLNVDDVFNIVQQAYEFTL